jgi:hypothetical protein
MIGPVGQASYRRHSILVASPAAITPTLSGIELVTNGNMEAGDPPTGWNAINDAVLAAATDERTGGVGTHSLKIARSNGGAWPVAYQIITTVVGTWYLFSAWSKRVDCDSTYPYVTGDIDIDAIVDTSTAWHNRIATSRATGTTPLVRLGVAANGADGNYGLFDDISVQAITLPSTLGDTVTLTGVNFSAEVSTALSTVTPVGAMLCIDDPANPQNFVLPYHDTTMAYLVKCVAGVYSVVASGAITYVSGGRIGATRTGNSWQLWYNGAAVDTSKTISDAGIIGNTQHTWWSTYAGNTFRNFRMW